MTSFISLNDKEFEDIARDLLQKKLGIFLESFKTGKDQGIDFRFSSDGKSNNLIIQAKHYEKSGFNAFFQKLKDEVPKVKVLAPLRYILVTSVGLSPKNKSLILELFEGFIKNTSDILGNDDLSNLLEIYPEVQRAHVKLYLSSLTVLNQIINNHIRERSEHKIREIQKQVHLYVTNKKYEDAIEILNKEHFLIITGEPGIGKTALCNFITYQHLSEGFHLTYIISDISDAEKVIDNEEKQLFYFDDFLGANYLKVKHQPNQDALLLSFIQRIINNKNKRLILTTRTTILNQAQSDFDRLNSPHLDVAKHEIKIQDYNFVDKALILYNHIYHSELPIEYFEEFVKRKTYINVITHPNYSPRIIEYISDLIRLKNINSDKYPEFVLDKLNHPEDIWKSPYEVQIKEADRFLLQTLFTLPVRTSEVNVRSAFNKRVSFEVRVNGFQKESNLFDLTLKNLLGGFLHRTISGENTFLRFYNPSFADFMSNYLTINLEETERIIDGILYFDQYTSSFDFEDKNLFDFGSLIGLNKISQFQDFMGTLWRPQNIDKVKISKIFVLQKLKLQLNDLIMISLTQSKELAICGFLIRNYELLEVEDLLLKLYLNIPLEQITSEQFEDLYQIARLLDEHEDSIIYELIITDKDRILIKLFELVKYEDDFGRIKDLFGPSLDYDSFIREYRNELQEIVDKYWSKEVVWDKIRDEDFNECYDEQDIINRLNEIENVLFETNDNLGLKKSPRFDDIFNWEYQDTIEQNKLRKHDSETHRDYQATNLASKSISMSNGDPESIIDNLFNDLLRSRIN